MEQSLINQLKTFFIRQPVEKVWIFGSYSRGEETGNSDIDILVRFDSKATITLLTYVGVVNALQKLLHKKVDLVEEGQLKDFAKASVEQSKILIYERGR
ncbi:putative nucleotidyltransferase [Bacteroidales bacterium Barb6XT]|nr:putative nucleotidyltransferase [Bacteroidales bacterium Barb6XT]